MGLPEEDKFISKSYEPSTAEQNAATRLVEDLRARTGCNEIDIKLNLPLGSGRTVLEGCGRDLFEYARQEKDKFDNESFHARVDAFHKRLGSYLDNVSTMSQPRHIGIAELTTIAVSSAAHGQSIIGLANFNYDAYTSNGSDEALEGAIANLIYAEDRMLRAEIFMAALQETQEFCTYDAEGALAALRSSVEAGEAALQKAYATGEVNAMRGGYLEASSLPAARLLLDHEAALGARNERISMDVNTALVLAEWESVLPTRGEAIHMVNTMIERSDRPGIRDRVLSVVPIPERWDEDGNEARRALAVWQVDLNDAFGPDCESDPS